MNKERQSLPASEKPLQDIGTIESIEEPTIKKYEIERLKIQKPMILPLAILFSIVAIVTMTIFTTPDPNQWELIKMVCVGLIGILGTSLFAYFKAIS